MLIVDHYDSEIRQVDILIEELLEKYNEEDLLRHDLTKYKNHDQDLSEATNSNEYAIEGFKDPYNHCKYDMSEFSAALCSIDEKTRTRDYLELVRSKTIVELKKAKQETLDSYEMNKHLYKYNREDLTDEIVEEMRRNLFKDKFCFVQFIDGNLLHKYLIITDFYLDQKDLDFLK